jgi:hypothetical protein
MTSPTGQDHSSLAVIRGRAVQHWTLNEVCLWSSLAGFALTESAASPRVPMRTAMNKLEKVALRYTKKKGRPLVLAFNSE